MIERKSKKYIKENCVCYDMIDNDNSIIAIRVEPDNGYQLVHKDGTEQLPVSGFALININSIEIFDNYYAISSDIDITDDDELTAEEALDIITGGSADEA